MKKILIIAYYFPPAAGVGTFRVTKFVKFLPFFGWKPIVLTVKTSYYGRLDNTLMSDISKNIKIYRTDIMNFPINDVGIKWLLPLLRNAQKIIKKEKIDVLYFTGGPFYQWRIAPVIKKKYNTCIIKYGVDNPNKSAYIRDKTKKTCIKKYNVNCSLQSKSAKEKTTNTCLIKYGTISPNQNKRIHEKQQISSLRFHEFKNTNIWYQGSYEHDFLEKFYDKIDIERGPSINYKYKNKNKVYHSDFYIPSLNLVIEIKSSYYYRKYKYLCKLKKKFCVMSGFNYIIILDKKYKLFKKEVGF